MRIKSRFLILTTLILLLTALFSWFSMRVLTEQIITSWVERYAIKQVQYDKVRTLLPLIKEVDLSKELAALASLKAWAKSPDDEGLKQSALSEVVAFGKRFANQSYFIGLKKNNHYYYNKGKVAPTEGAQLLLLDPSKPSDAWFFNTMKTGLKQNLNVNFDAQLGITTLWTDVLIKEGDEILGIVGTGLDLSTFLDDVLKKQDVYSSIVFTNDEGSIQLYQQQEQKHPGATTKPYQNNQPIFEFLDDAESSARLKQHFTLAKAAPNTVEMATVYKGGRRQLASIIYIPEIDWFEVNFIDINRFLPMSEFSGLLMVFFVSLVIALLAVYFLLTVIVTKPLAELESSMHALEKSRYQEPKLSRFAGLEIKRLVAYYQQMSKSILDYQHDLEAKVAQRTQELNKLSKSDPLTGLYNRRGLEDFFTEYMFYWQQKRQVFGLINVDINHFKQVNDQHGHIVGDQVLQKVAKRLTQLVADKGIVVRWGGDEFLLLIKKATIHDIEHLTEQLIKDREALQMMVDDQVLTISLSLGSTLIEEGDSLEDMLHRADSAMYKMKFLDR